MSAAARYEHESESEWSAVVCRRFMWRSVAIGARNSRPSSTKEMGIGVLPDRHVPMGSVARLREHASVPRIMHYCGKFMQLVVRNRARSFRCIPGEENEFRIARPWRDVLMADQLVNIQIRRLRVYAAPFVAR